MPKSKKGAEHVPSNAALGTALGIAGVAMGSLMGYIAGRTSPSPNRSTCPPITRSPRSPLPPQKLNDVEENEATSNLDAANKDCLICLQNFEFIKRRGGDVHTTPCGHIFCHQCIYQCLSRKESCPICRAKVSPEETIKIFL